MTSSSPEPSTGDDTGPGFTTGPVPSAAREHHPEPPYRRLPADPDSLSDTDLRQVLAAESIANDYQREQ